MSNIRSFEKNKENPFLKEAIEQIQSGIVKKYKNTSGSSRNAILQAVNSDGELVGHTSFIQQIEVDEEKFTKIYLSQFSAFFELNQQGIKVFGYIMTKLTPKQDMFIFLMDECREYTGYKNPLFPSTIGSALGGFRFSIIFRKHSSTSAVIGIFLVPLVVLVS